MLNDYLSLGEVLKYISGTEILRILTAENFRRTGKDGSMIEFKSAIRTRTKDGIDVVLEALTYIHSGTVEALGQLNALRLTEVPQYYRLVV